MTDVFKRFLLISLLFINIKIVVGQEEIQLGSGTSTNSYFPLYYLYDFSYTQTIYTAAELTGAGAPNGGAIISAIKYKPTVSVSTENWCDWVVYIGHTTKTGFSDVNDFIPIASLSQVYSSTILDNTTANNWITITLSTPFVWNGSDNIIIAIDENTSGWGNSPSWAGYTLAPSTGYKGIYYYQDENDISAISPNSASNKGYTNTVAQIQFVMTPNYACSAPPTGGTIVLSPTSGNPGSAISGSVSGASTGTGLTYQWQYSDDNGAIWSDISEETNATLSSTAKSSLGTRQYRRAISCSGQTAYSEPATFTTQIEYCEATHGTVETINRVLFAGIDNTSTGTSAYEDFTTISGSVNPGEEYEITVWGNTNGNFTNYITVWIDWNQDGVFDNADENYDIGSFTNNTDGSCSNTISVPSGVPSGNVRMRVRKNFNTSPSSACGSTDYGQTEDYSLMIGSLSPCSGIPNSGTTVLTPNSGVISSTVNGSVTNSTIASGLTYQWQYSEDGSTWSDISGETIENLTTTSSSNIGTYYYRRATICNTDTAFSTPAQYSVEKYCTPEGTNSSRYINNFVTTEGISNITNNNSGFSNGGYGNFTNLVVEQFIGETINFHANIEGGTAGFRIWVDWNNDGMFSSNEVVFNTTTYTSNPLGSFAIPSSTQAGSYRMRIASHYFSPIGDVDPCETGFTNGEFEDYTLQCAISYNNCNEVNHSGADWTISSNTTIGGKHINVGNFVVNSGVTVTVLSQCVLEVEAQNITINGIINGDYAGNAGGNGGEAGTLWTEGEHTDGRGITSCYDKNYCRELRLYGGKGGTNGSGAGGGAGGNTAEFKKGVKQECNTFGDDGGRVAGAGGAGGGKGGGYGGAGGKGGKGGKGGDETGCDVSKCGSTNNIGGSSGEGATVGGTSHGSTTTYDIQLGAGGGGGGGGGRGAVGDYSSGNSGGNGGGAIMLKATNNLTLSASANIYMRGANGGSGGSGGDSSVSGYCCEDLSPGCDEQTFSGSGGGGGGAGGGSGGGILLSALGEMTLTSGSVLDVTGGNGGTGGKKGYGEYFDNAENGGSGGGGGGGRIKIFKNPCANNTLSSTNKYNGGNGYGSGGNGTYTINEHAVTIPQQPSSISGEINICSGSNGTYSVTNVDGVSYNWDYSGSANISGSTNSINLNDITSSGTLSVSPQTGLCIGTERTITINVITPNSIGLISNDYVWTGATSTNWNNTTNKNWLVYSGINFTIPTSTPNANSNVFIRKTNNCFTDAPVVNTVSNAICKNLTIDEDNTLSIENNGELTIKGNLENNGSLIATSGKLIFNGSGNTQNIKTNNASFGDVEFNNNEGKFFIEDAVKIVNVATFTKGIVKLENSATFTFGNNASSNEGTATSYVDGLVTKQGNSAFVFPVGDSTIWAPIGITSPSSASNISAKYFFETPPYINWNNTYMCANSNMHHVSGIEYWELTSSNSNPSVILHWKDGLRSGVANIDSLTVAHWNSVCWENKGVAARTGNVNSGSITSLIPFDSYSPITFGTTKPVNPLPIELLHFDVNCDGNNRIVSWSTATEINNDYFVVEHSTNGIIFDEITQIQGAGNSNVVNNYFFVDDSYISENIYYRLKQIDFDGTSKTFDIQVVNCNNETQVIIVKPNPFKEIVEIIATIDGNNNIEVFNSLGKLVYQEKVYLNDVKQLNLSNLKYGMYMLRITESNGKMYNFKLIKN